MTHPFEMLCYGAPPRTGAAIRPALRTVPSDSHPRVSWRSDRASSRCATSAEWSSALALSMWSVWIPVISSVRG